MLEIEDNVFTMSYIPSPFHIFIFYFDPGPFEVAQDGLGLVILLPLSPTMLGMQAYTTSHIDIDIDIDIGIEIEVEI